MINKIYLLESDVGDYCSFIKHSPDGEESIMGRSVDEPWVPFGKAYFPITLELIKNNFGKKNYHFDISSAICSFFCSW